MWTKVGIDLTLDVRESGVITTIQTNKQHPDLTRAGGGLSGKFFSLPVLTPGAFPNTSIIDDPVINQETQKERLVAITDMPKAMGMFRELTKYILDQAYVLPGPAGYSSTFWWPWVKNYSGETNVGYFKIRWPQYVWYDQALKKSMGY